MNRKQFLAVIGAVIAAPFIKKPLITPSVRIAPGQLKNGETFLVVAEGQAWSQGRASGRAWKK